MTDGDMGVSINYTIRIREEGKHPVLDIMPITGTMADTYGITFQNKGAVLGKGFLGYYIAHISVYSIDVFMTES